jgi:hypothetical protein
VFVVLALIPSAASPQGNPLGGPFRVNTYTPGSQNSPAVASDSSGNFVVVWASHQQDGSQNGVFGQRFADTGAPVGPEFRVNTYTTHSQGHAAVASDSSGNFVVVWTSGLQDGSASGVFGQRYASSGTPLGPEFRVNTYTAGEQDYPGVASDPTGSVVVVWSSDGQDGSSFGVFGQRYANSGAPLGGEFPVNTYTTGGQSVPSIASDSLGNFVVVWESGQDGSGKGAFGQRYSSSGAPLGPEFRINTFTTGPQSFPAVASDSSGNFVVAWSGDGPGKYDLIFGQRYARSGAPLDSQFVVATAQTFYPRFPRATSVTSDSSGNFVVAWSDYYGVYRIYEVFARTYASSGAPISAPFLVGGGSMGGVASDSTGNAMVVWSNLGQDGSSEVFGRRYSPIFPVELMHFGVE